MKPGATVRALSFCAFLSAAVPAYPTPFSVVNTPPSGERGTAFTSALFDGGVDMLEAADILLTFDSDFFIYLGSTVGSATAGFSFLAGNSVSTGGSLLQLEISLATGGGPVNGIAGSLVDVSFLIKPNAPLGESNPVVFQSLPLSDYDIPITSGTVTVTQAAGVPEPASWLLVGLATLALRRFRLPN